MQGSPAVSALQIMQPFFILLLDLLLVSRFRFFRLCGIVRVRVTAVLSGTRMLSRRDFQRF
jgi:hypothetical protein